MHVLDHHDGGRDHRPESDGDSTQAHDVRAQPHVAHYGEGHQNPEGKRDDGHQRAAHVEEEYDAHESHDERLLEQLLLQVVDRTLDEFRPVVHGADDHAGRQSVFEFCELCLDPLDRSECVLSDAHDDNRADHVPAAVQVGDPPSRPRRELHGGYVGDSDRRSRRCRSEHDVLQVANALDVAQPADHVLPLRHLDDHGPDVLVRGPNRSYHLRHRDPEASQLHGIHRDLVHPLETAHRSDFTHTRDGRELIAQVPILKGSEIRQRQDVGGVLEDVLVDPSESRGVRPQGRFGAGGKFSPDPGQVLEDPAPSPIEIRIVVEDDVDEGDSEEGVPTYDFGPGDLEHLRRDGIGDLVFDQPRRLALVIGLDDDLDIRDVR